MKVCKYCRLEAPDSERICSSCGAIEFRTKCSNCGNVYDEGVFCPRCGVKAGKQAKKCPRCGTEYYSAACPDCGYIPTYQPAFTSAVYYQPDTEYIPEENQQPQPRRKIWLWVLGWIFIFPVPLTILIARNQRLDKKTKVGIIVAIWAFIFFLGILNGIKESIQKSVGTEKGTSYTIVSEETLQEME